MSRVKVEEHERNWPKTKKPKAPVKAPAKKKTTAAKKTPSQRRKLKAPSQNTKNKPRISKEDALGKAKELRRSTAIAILAQRYGTKHTADLVDAAECGERVPLGQGECITTRNFYFARYFRSEVEGETLWIREPCRDPLWRIGATGRILERTRHAPKPKRTKAPAKMGISYTQALAILKNELGSDSPTFHSLKVQMGAQRTVKFGHGKRSHVLHHIGDNRWRHSTTTR